MCGSDRERDGENERQRASERERERESEIEKARERDSERTREKGGGVFFANTALLSIIMSTLLPLPETLIPILQTPKPQPSELNKPKPPNPQHLVPCSRQPFLFSLKRAKSRLSTWNRSTYIKFSGNERVLTRGAQPNPSRATIGF